MWPIAKSYRVDAIERRRNEKNLVFNRVIKITLGGDITVIVGATSDGQDNTLKPPGGIALKSVGVKYVAAFGSDNSLRIALRCAGGPAVSECGLVATTLLVQTIATLIYRQRPTWP